VPWILGIIIGRLHVEEEETNPDPKIERACKKPKFPLLSSPPAERNL
jgi:hypothetical protein